MPADPIEVSFTVPSGNFGNILSGFFAKQMGLPVRRLVLAANENNVLDEFFRTGIYRPRAAAQTLATSSPSMDISKASNLERFIFDLVGRDPLRVVTAWRELDEQGYFDLSRGAAAVRGGVRHRQRHVDARRPSGDDPLRLRVDRARSSIRTPQTV